MRISLRQLGLFVAAVGIACVSVKFANDVVWTILASIALLLLMVNAVVALVDSGERRAVATGTLACAVIYWGLVVLGDRELDPYRGRMPTSKLLLPVYESIVVREQVPLPANSVGGSTMIERPKRSRFMLVAHLSFAILFGWLGGQFARTVFRRQANTV